MTNLLKETKDKLKIYGHTIKDIEWVGCRDYQIPLELFLRLADEEYSDGFGAQEVATDLLVVGDSWWLERHEYDGSEWWEYKSLPQKPKEIKTVKKVVGDLWETLTKMNEENQDG